jgi:hypothetical protein
MDPHVSSISHLPPILWLWLACSRASMPIHSMQLWRWWRLTCTLALGGARSHARGSCLLACLCTVVCTAAVMARLHGRDLRMCLYVIVASRPRTHARACPTARITHPHREPTVQNGGRNVTHPLGEPCGRGGMPPWPYDATRA